MIPVQAPTMRGVEKPNSDPHGQRFRVRFKHGWYAVEAQTPHDGDQSGEWVRITGFSHKGDADRYCEFLNKAVIDFFTS